MILGIGSITPEMATAAISMITAAWLLKAQKEAREKLYPFADESLTLAEEGFAAHMELRAYDQVVYDDVKSLPMGAICYDNIWRGKQTGHFTQAPLVKQNAFGLSRYNCGDREAAILASLSAALITSEEVAAQAYNFEELISDAADTLKWTSVAQSATFREPNLSGVYGQVGDSLARRASILSKATDGAIAGASYFVRAEVNNRREARAETAARNAEMDRRQAAYDNAGLYDTVDNGFD